MNRFDSKINYYVKILCTQYGIYNYKYDKIRKIIKNNEICIAKRRVNKKKEKLVPSIKV